ncbi:MAG: hypothetical protein LBC39_08625 [Methanobrevibacter sp.]|nr:hypothetical protein [Candidatus Methanovirga aequatorialis]
MRDHTKHGGLHDINQEVSLNIVDLTRRRYLKELSEYTGRNTIIYYSGWLQKRNLGSDLLSINDNDKLGFMSTIQNMDRKKGLDLVLHTLVEKLLLQNL